MRLVIQRVSEAKVIINGSINGQIGKGFLILLGIESIDDKEDADWLCKKIASMRIFNDEEDKMNLTLKEVNGEILIVSQFTLHASTKKGNRPSFIKAARPEQAIPLYEYFIQAIKTECNCIVATGSFGADMKVTLTNDGPVTILLDSKNKE
jgi:D-tyrosyl-tRNA(Tyr) deacylase